MKQNKTNQNPEVKPRRKSDAGFIYRHAVSLSMFLDGPTARARDAVHIVFAAERLNLKKPSPSGS